MLTPEEEAELAALEQEIGTLGDQISSVESSPWDKASTRPWYSVDVGKALWNAPGSAVNLVGGLLDMALSPVQTTKALGKMALGTLEGAGEQAVDLVTGRDWGTTQFGDMSEKYSDPLVLQLAEDWGGVENVKQRFENDPVGLVTDVVGGIKALGTGVVKSTAKNAALSAVNKAAQKTVGALDYVDPMVGLGKTAKGAGKLVKHARNSTLQQMQRSGMGWTLNQVQELAGKNYLKNEQSVYDFVNKHNLYGTATQMRDKLDEVKAKAYDKSSEIAAQNITSVIDGAYRPVLGKAILRQLGEVKSKLKPNQGKHPQGQIPGDSDFFNFKDTADDAIATKAAEVMNILREPKPTSAQMLRLRRMSDELLDIYGPDGKLKKDADSMGLRGHMEKLREDLRKANPEMAKYDKDVQVASKMSRITKGSNTSGLVDSFLLWSSGSSLMTGMAKVAGRRFLSSPAVKTFVATKLSQMTDVAKIAKSSLGSAMTATGKSLPSSMSNQTLMAFAALAKDPEFIKTMSRMSFQAAYAQDRSENDLIFPE